jgi:DEAD/DEAH box helicase domain-containing protein
MNSSEAPREVSASIVTSATTPQKHDDSIRTTILSAMSRIDPFLRFLTKATGKTSVPLKMLCQVLPKSNLDGTSSDHSEHIEKSDDVNNNNNNNNNNCNDSHLHAMLLELSYRGVLTYDTEKKAVGFPLPPSPSNSNDTCAIQPTCPSAHSDVLKNAPSKLIGKGLHGSSEASAKRRMKVLKWSLELVPSSVCKNIETETAQLKLKSGPNVASSTITSRTPTKDERTCSQYDPKSVAECEMDQIKQVLQDPYVVVDERFDECIERRAAFRALDALFSPKNGKADSDDRVDKNLPCHWLPCQAAYAGSHLGRRVRHGVISKETAAKIPPELLKLFELDLTGSESNILGRTRRRLFLHQARAIESAMSNVHTVVQTSTGSGKSLCFLLPVLAKAMISLQQGEVSSAIVLFPTKALAQDQFSKIVALLRPLANGDSDLTPIRVGVIDGDTPHSKRDEIATECQIILTNPDTLHAAMLPNWKKNRAYQKLLARITTVVIDESHVYEGAFGAHVAMVLRRLLRVCRVASSPSNTGNAESATSILFISCSATMVHPEEHFRLLCPIGKEEEVCVLTSKDDGSPCPPKHFFVWNPPILDVNGN